MNQVDYPNVTIWDDDDWKKLTAENTTTKSKDKTQGKSSTSSLWKYAFLCSADGVTISRNDNNKMAAELRSICKEIWTSTMLSNGTSIKPSPPMTWTNVPRKIQIYIMRKLQHIFHPIFSLCSDGHWKVWKFACLQYPSYIGSVYGKGKEKFVEESGVAEGSRKRRAPSRAVESVDIDLSDSNDENQDSAGSCPRKRQRTQGKTVASSSVRGYNFSQNF